MTKEQIGQAIANARKEQGITIRRMAEMAGLTPRAVQAVEKPLKWWQRALMMLGGVMLVVTGLTLAHWLGKRQKNI